VTDDGFAQRVSKVGALADPIRRALYRFVARQPGAVSRDQAAQGIEVPRHTAKFHLDKLVEEGLLTTEFRRLTGRSGPGAGRPAKLYRRTRNEINVSLPHRRYDLASHVLADAVERALDGTPMADALRDAADNAAAVVLEAQPPDDGSDLSRVDGVLARLGYEPRQDGEAIALGNCPFDRLSADHRALVCGMNHQFVESLDRRLGCDHLEVVDVQPGPGCCVRIEQPADHA
jgi:predicted ArsR family transcriptional regulator